MLDLYRGLAERRAAQRAGEWKPLPFREIAGTVRLIVGYGDIGRADDLFIANLPRYAAGETLANEVDLGLYLETPP